MKTADQILKLQTQLSAWSGTKIIAGRLAIFGVALCATGTVLGLVGEARSFRMLSSSLVFVVICMLLRSRAQKKVAEIEGEISS